MEQPLVAISYPVDDEVREANLDVLGDEAQVVSLQDLQPSERSEMLRPAQALIGRRLGRELAPGQLAEARRLRLIQFLSAGVDNVDFAAIPGHRHRGRTPSPRGTPQPTCGGTSRAGRWPGRSGGRTTSQPDGLAVPLAATVSARHRQGAAAAGRAKRPPPARPAAGRSCGSVVDRCEWGRSDGPAVGQQLPVIVEQHDTVAEQAPALLEMGRHDACGAVVRRQSVRASGLMLAHVDLRLENDLLCCYR